MPKKGKLCHEALIDKSEMRESGMGNSCAGAEGASDGGIMFRLEVRTWEQKENDALMSITMHFITIINLLNAEECVCE